MTPRRAARACRSMSDPFVGGRFGFERGGDRLDRDPAGRDQLSPARRAAPGRCHRGGSESGAGAPLLDSRRELELAAPLGHFPRSSLGPGGHVSSAVHFESAGTTISAKVLVTAGERLTSGQSVAWLAIRAQPRTVDNRMVDNGDADAVSSLSTDRLRRRHG